MVSHPNQNSCFPNVITLCCHFQINDCKTALHHHWCPCTNTLDLLAYSGFIESHCLILVTYILEIMCYETITTSEKPHLLTTCSTSMEVNIFWSSKAWMQNPRIPLPHNSQAKLIFSVSVASCCSESCRPTCRNKKKTGIAVSYGCCEMLTAASRLSSCQTLPGLSVRKL